MQTIERGFLIDQPPSLEQIRRIRELGVLLNQKGLDEVNGELVSVEDEEH